MLSKLTDKGVPTVISPTTHGVIDYCHAAFFFTVGVFCARSHNKAASRAAFATSSFILVQSLLTDYRLGAKPVISFETHGKMDTVFAASSWIMPLLFGFKDTAAAKISVTSLTLTYLMQIYSQLQQRNTFALKVYLATRRTGDAAVLVAGLAPDGEWSHGSSALWEFAAEVAATKEAHHFYPVLFYMRFAEHFYSVSFATLVLLDAVTIIRSAPSDQYGSVKNLRALDQIWDGSLLLLTSLEETFLPGGAPSSQRPGPEQTVLWDDRIDDALDQLAAAGLATSERGEARRKYLELRSQWDSHIQRLAPSMLYSMQKIDAATYGRTMKSVF